MLKPYRTFGITEVGIDETGKGPLAGPVVTAAVILPNDFNDKLIRDSKTLSDKQLEKVYNLIKENAIAYSVKASSVVKINSVGIDEATFNAMHECLNDLIVWQDITINHILVDGNRFTKYKNIEHSCIIKGDNEYTSIAAASILAKVDRDNYMRRLHELYPKYNFQSNKGYGTKEHIQAIKDYGVIQSHRKLFVRNFI